MIHEMISSDRNMVQYINNKKAGNPNALDRQPFSKVEITKVWDFEKSNEYISVILMLIYTGVRIGKLPNLKKEDVHLDEHWFFVKESKTNASIRAVPIAEKIAPFFEKWMSKNKCENILSTHEGQPFDYRNNYDSYWTPLIETMKMAHRPHDTRHTCISLLTVAGVDERIIKKIV